MQSLKIEATRNGDIVKIEIEQECEGSLLFYTAIRLVSTLSDQSGYSPAEICEDIAKNTHSDDEESARLH